MDLLDHNGCCRLVTAGLRLQRQPQLFSGDAFLNSFVTRNGVTTTTNIISAGPASCCTTPSNGFTYTGTVNFDLAAGDSYGFTFGGSNGDSSNF